MKPRREQASRCPLLFLPFLNWALSPLTSGGREGEGEGEIEAEIDLFCGGF